MPKRSTHVRAAAIACACGGAVLALALWLGRGPIGWAAGAALGVGIAAVVWFLGREREGEPVHLARRILASQEDERTRLARDLHDEVGQLLTVLRLEMGWLERRADRSSPEQAAWLDQILDLINRSNAELRRICQGLRPPLLDELGLGPAVRHLVEDFGRRTGLEVDVHAEPEDSFLSVPREQALSVYRILQESLNNVVRHARARRVEVALWLASGQLRLEVRDDGVGFDAEVARQALGWGLAGMRERAALIGGDLQIETAPGRGTRLSLWVRPASRNRQEGS